jgi:hypothetical protein
MKRSRKLLLQNLKMTELVSVEGSTELLLGERSPNLKLMVDYSVESKMTGQCLHKNQPPCTQTLTLSQDSRVCSELQLLLVKVKQEPQTPVAVVFSMTKTMIHILSQSPCPFSLIMLLLPEPLQEVFLMTSKIAKM